MGMVTKYTNAIDDNVAIMTLYGEIGSPGWEAEAFTYEMSYHVRNGRAIKVYINSPGGSVFGGYALIQAILDYEADTHIVGLAASMAGIIAQFGKRRTMNDFAVGMIHMPTSSKKNDKLLGTIAEKLLDILESRCTKPRAELQTLMEAETFFDATEMLEMGFVDEVISTSINPVSNLTELKVDDLYEIYNSIIKKDEMKQLRKHFKLDDDATEEIIISNIVDLENAVSQNTEELSAKDAEISKLQEELEKMRSDSQGLTEELANHIVDDAIAGGKIEKNKKDIWVDAAKKDPKGTKAQLDSISVVKNVSVQTSVINSNGKPALGKPEDDIINWVRNNAKELIAMEQEDPERFNELMNLYQKESAK